MLLAQAQIRHVSTILHEGKVILVATDGDRRLWYSVKQDGFEDSYLDAPPSERTGWEDWRPLELPDEPKDDASVVAFERERLADAARPGFQVLRSLYRTRDASAAAPVQLVSAFACLYVFRQSQGGTLLVDRFVLDGISNRLVPRLEVRFRRSRQRHWPSAAVKVGGESLRGVDTLDFRDTADELFREPTLELALVENLQHGWFTVVLVPTNEHDRHAWHIFAHDRSSGRIEHVALRASDEGLFDPQDQLLLEPASASDATAVPRVIPGITRRTLELSGVTVTGGPTATRYDLQQERVVDNGRARQLLRADTRLMLAIPTDRGVATISFALAADGALSEINREGATRIVRGAERELLLPLTTLEQVRPLADASPTPQGVVAGLQLGTDADGVEGKVVVAAGQATGLVDGDVVKLSATRPLDGRYRVAAVDGDQFVLDDTEGAAPFGRWEQQEVKEGGLYFDGMITGYRRRGDGRIEVSAPGHGLVDGDQVQVAGTSCQDGAYTVTCLGDQHFALDLPWSAGAAINVRLESRRRRGLVFDGVDDRVDVPPHAVPQGDEVTVALWARGGATLPRPTVLLTAVDADGLRQLLLHLPWADGRIFFDCGGQAGTFDRLAAQAEPADYRGGWTHWAFTKNAATGRMAIYRNGELWREGGGMTLPLRPVTRARIGDNIGAAYPYEGTVAELSIWGRVLPVEEIRGFMHRPLTGRELGLRAYWPLGGVAEGPARRVLDLSGNGCDGTVVGGAFVSAATLPRQLGERPAVRYRNDELHAVSQQASYLEEVEFRVLADASPLDLAQLNDADGAGGRVFEFSVWGKTSRGARDTVTIATRPEPIVPLPDGWFRAACRYTAPIGVTLIRDFDLGPVRGAWTTLQIRRHRIRDVSDSISERRVTDSVALATLADGAAGLTAKLAVIAAKEAVVRPKRVRRTALERKLAAAADLAALTAEVAALRQSVAALQAQAQVLTQAYQAKIVDPFNWYCILYNAAAGKTVSVQGTDSLTIAADGASGANLWRFVSTGDGAYFLHNAAELDHRRVHCFGRNMGPFPGMRTILYATMQAPLTNSDVMWQKWRVVSGNDGTYYITNDGAGPGKRLQAFNFGGTLGLWVEADLPLQSGGIWQKWWIERTGRPANDAVELARAATEQKLAELRDRQTLLAARESILAEAAAQRGAWASELQQLTAELTSLDAELTAQTHQFLAELRATSRPALALPQLAVDARKLRTTGALLGFARPRGRLHALESCEGAVHLGFLDAERRARLLRFDAAADASNATYEQWLPELPRACLDLHGSDAGLELPRAVPLGGAWSVEAWFDHPLPSGEFNTLVASADGEDGVIVVDRDGALGLRIGGVFRPGPRTLHDLALGWHHVCAVCRTEPGAVSATVVFYLDGARFSELEVTLTRPLQVGRIGRRYPGAAAVPAVRCGAPGRSVTLPPSSFPGGGTQLSVSFWARGGASLPRETAVLNVVDAGQRRVLMIHLPWSDGVVYFDCGDATTYDRLSMGASAVDYKGEWRHWAFTKDAIAGEMKIYRDGALWNRGAGCHRPIGTAAQVQFGCAVADPGRCYDGDLAELCMWDRALSEAEVRAVMGPVRGDEAGLVGCWRLDAGRPIERSVRALHGEYSGDPTRLAADASGLVLRPPPASADERGFGKLCEVRLWEVALTDDEVESHCKFGCTGHEPGLAAYYPLDEARGAEVRDRSGRGRDGVLASERAWSACTAAIGRIDVAPPADSQADALLSAEYSTINVDPATGRRLAVMRRLFVAPAAGGVAVWSDQRIESLDLRWIGNAQFAPTLLGYIEGAPPVPSENLTVDLDYRGATSVGLTVTDDVEMSWNRSQEVGGGLSLDTFVGVDKEAYAGLGVMTKAADIRAGLKGSLNVGYRSQADTTVRAGATQRMTDRLELRGHPEKTPRFAHLGARFVPKNVGYALVISGLADVFVSRLARSGKMVGYQVLPIDGLPPDVNTITFLMNPAYVMQGSLDGLTGSQATSERFFRHVPEMRRQYGALYPASYYRLQEAYDLKRQIEGDDKRRESYFAQFDARAVGAALDRQIERGEAAAPVALEREDGSQDPSEVARRQSEIDAKIGDADRRTHARASFEGWQRKMEDILLKAGKRDIVNTYVWDADGGLRAEAQSFASTVEHSMGGSFVIDASLGGEAHFGVFGAKVELTALATLNLAQTMRKTESRSTGVELSVDLSGVECTGVTDHDDNPLVPGEKVDRYRFMSFYLGASTRNFHDFFRDVVDPEWLRGNDEEARALRQAMGKANRAWRVLHRVTYVERPALQGFGRDVRPLGGPEAATQAAVNYFLLLSQKQQALEARLDEALGLLRALATK
jgi:hypothetical protein